MRAAGLQESWPEAGPVRVGSAPHVPKRPAGHAARTVSWQQQNPGRGAARRSRGAGTLAPTGDAVGLWACERLDAVLTGTGRQYSVSHGVTKNKKGHRASKGVSGQHSLRWDVGHTSLVQNTNGKGVSMSEAQTAQETYQSATLHRVRTKPFLDHLH